MTRGAKMFLLATLLVTVVVAPVHLAAQNSNGPSIVTAASSPVDTFRQLLAMSPEEREKNLANRKPEARQQILAKLAEYQSLNPYERQLRLRATELRWWLLPLMRQSRTDRTAGLALVPKEYRELVEDRLTRWDLLPPPLQTELLGNEEAARLLTQVETITAAQRKQLLDRLPPGQRQQVEAGLERWQKMSEAEQRATSKHFELFFELTETEQENVLGTFTEAERQQMEQTLQSFEKLPREERQACIRSFEKFASMNTRQREQFLKNAERWRQMSSSEREVWRKLVNKVPDWPPLPPGLGDAPPPLPPDFQHPPQSPVTNRGG